MNSVSDTPNSESARGSKTSLRTVERALSVLEYVAAPGTLGRRSVKQISEALGWNLSTAYHLVGTLRDQGYLVQRSDKQHRIGGKLATLHQALVRELDVASELNPLVQALADATGETAFLATWSDGQLTLMNLAESPQSVAVSGLYVGLTGNEHNRASGKAALAQVSERELDRFLARCRLNRRTSETITDEQTLRVRLKEISQQVFAVDREEFAPGVCCVAAPYFHADGRVGGTLAVSTPVSRFDETSLVEHVLRFATEASRVLGFNGSYPSSASH